MPCCSNRSRCFLLDLGEIGVAESLLIGLQHRELVALEGMSPTALALPADQKVSVATTAITRISFETDSPLTISSAMDCGRRRRYANDEVGHAAPGGVTGNDEQHQRGNAAERVAAEKIIGNPPPHRDSGRAAIGHDARLPRNMRYTRDHPFNMEMAETGQVVARGKPRGTAEAGAAVPRRHGPHYKSW